MIRFENPNGYITVSENYFAKLIGSAASSCVGVVGMANRSAAQSIKGFITRNTPSDKGVSVKFEGGCLFVDLHIIVSYGLNISAISKSIINKVKYTVEESTGLKVKKVNIFVDAIAAE